MYAKLENYTVIELSETPIIDFIEVPDFVTVGYYSENGIDWTSKECNPIFVAIEEAKKQNAFLVEQRLADFAKQKDIDIQEIAMLLNCSNEVWRNEATTFSNLYAETWQAFYNAISTDWAEIESNLPVLEW